MAFCFKKLRFVLLLALLSPYLNGYAQQLWYVNAGVGNDTYNGQSPTDDGGGVGPFLTIQTAVVSANDGDTILVSDGDYYGFLHIDKSLVIHGANVGVFGQGTRSAESVLYPNARSLSTPADNTNSLVQITSGNVVFDGLTLNGSNPAVLSGNDVDGEDVDYSYGLIVLGGLNQVVVRNNRILNFDKSGVHALGNVNAPNTNCYIGDNDLDNFGVSSTAITCGNGYYADIVRNRINRTEIGVEVYDFTMNSGRPLQVSQNDISCRVVGVLMYDINQNTSNTYIDKNDIKVAAGSAGDAGVSIRNCQGNYNLEVRDNHVDGFDNGILFFETDLPVRAVVNDSIKNCNTGLASISSAPQASSDSLSVEACHITTCGNNGIAIFADTVSTIVQMSGTSITDCFEGIYAAGNVVLRPGNTRFDNISSYFIDLDVGNSDFLSSEEVDARYCTFDGDSAKNKTALENFDIEDQIRHHLDDDQFAFVRTHDNNVYITGNDGNDQVTRGLNQSMADDNIHMLEFTTSEVVNVDKAIHLRTYNTVQIGTMMVNVPGGNEVELHDSLTIADGLRLNSGRLNTLDGHCTIGELLVKSGVGSVTAAGASYVNGPLEIVVETSGDDTLNFPVGTSNSYRPLQVILTNSSLGGWDKILASLEPNPNQGLPTSDGLSHVSDIHYYNLEPGLGLSHDNIVYKASYSVFGSDDEAGDAANLRLAHINNGKWRSIGGAGSMDNNGTIESTLPVTSISPISLANLKHGANRLGKTNLVASFDANSVCEGVTVNFENNSTAFRGSITSHAWDFGDATVTNDTSVDSDPSFLYNAPGVYTVRLIVMSDSGDVDTAFQDINVYANPVVGFIDEIYCFPDAAEFTDTSIVIAPDNLAFRTWTIDGTSYSTSTVTHGFASTGNYDAKLHIETQFGCKDSVTRSFTVGDSVKISISPAGPISICEGESVQLTASSGIQRYSWNTGETANFINATQARTYIVTGFNSNYCFGIDSVTVSTTPSPIAEAGNDVFLEYGESTVLQGSGGTNYTWSPPDRLDDPNKADPKATPLETTRYYLTVTNAQGCSSVDSVLVVVGAPKRIDVPNLLTPNGDQSNDVWDLSQVPDIENTKVSVLNRWGKVVFSAENYQHNWDGTYEGNPLPDGTYLYIIEGSEFYETLKGPLQIIR
jgi:gliding motility-associated-like protein